MRTRKIAAVYINFRNFSAFEEGAHNNENWREGNFLIKLSTLWDKIEKSGRIDEMRRAGGFTVKVHEAQGEYVEFFPL